MNDAVSHTRKYSRMVPIDRSTTLLTQHLAPERAPRYTQIGVALTGLIAVVDVAIGHHATLIGLLIAGPCTTMLTRRTRPTITVSLCAVGLAVALGIPDGIWMTYPHILFISAVTLVAASNTAAATLMQHHRAWNRPGKTAGPTTSPSHWPGL